MTLRPWSSAAPTWQWRDWPESAEKWLKKPVIAINTATYWYAMRANGMDDVVEGFGSLMTDFQGSARQLPESCRRTRGCRRHLGGASRG